MIVAFEGIDYSGKSRLMDRVIAHLISQDVDYLSVREPGGYSNLLRDYAINECSGEYERSVMMLADRILTHNKVIKPYLKRNQDKNPLVLSDRCYLTTLVYQGMVIDYDDYCGLCKTHDRLFAEGAILPPDVIFIIRPNIDDVISRMTDKPKGGKLDATETTDRDNLIRRDENYLKTATGGVYDLIKSISPKIVEITEDDLEKQLAIVLEYISA